jgi:hypothetical protein
MVWRGEHIEVGQNALGKPVWAWWACVRCHRELISGRAIEVGLHPICLNRAGEAEAERLRKSARERDRLRYARDHGIG